MGRLFSRRLREQRQAIQQALDEARILHVTEKYFDLLQKVEKNTKEPIEEEEAPTPAASSLSPFQANAGLHATGQRGKDDPLELRQKRVSDFISTASAALFRRASECLGSRAAVSGGRIFPGMLVKGTVVRVLRQAAILDIGVGSDAWLMEKDVLLPLEPQRRGGLRQLLKEGDVLYSVVAKASKKELRVSLLPLRQLAAWEVLAKAAQTQETLVATKQQAIAGGLVVRVLGIQGFLPESHVCDTALLQPQQQQQQQQPLIVQVLHADISRRRLLVSQRLPRSRTELMLKKTAPGDLVSGTVVEVHPFGCVIQFGSSRALLHVSEISHLAVDATLVFHRGDGVRAIVKSYDPASGKIWLSTKALERYPGQILRERQKVFDEAEVAAAKYREQLDKIQQQQEAAAQQLMRSLGMDAEQPQAHPQANKEDSALEGDKGGLWWGLKSDSKLLQFLEHRLQQQRKEEEKTAVTSTSADGVRLGTLKEDEEPETSLVQLPGGGSVKVRTIRRNPQDESASLLAAAAAEALEVRSALQQSKIILGGNWQVPKVSEGPLENDVWEFV